MALLLHQRPSRILHLQGSEAWLFEVDYRLLMDELDRIEAGDDGADDDAKEKIEKMRKWKQSRT
jgi:hypothetical protein